MKMKERKKERKKEERKKKYYSVFSFFNVKFCLCLKSDPLNQKLMSNIFPDRQGEGERERQKKESGNMCERELEGGGMVWEKEREGRERRKS
jgi:hypothetical protein